MVEEKQERAHRMDKLDRIVGKFFYRPVCTYAATDGLCRRSGVCPPDGVRGAYAQSYNIRAERYDFQRMGIGVH